MRSEDRLRIENWLDNFWLCMENGSSIEWGKGLLLQVMEYAYRCGKYDAHCDNMDRCTQTINEIEKKLGVNNGR